MPSGVSEDIPDYQSVIRNVKYPQEWENVIRSVNCSLGLSEIHQDCHNIQCHNINRSVRVSAEVS